MSPIEALALIDRMCREGVGPLKLPNNVDGCFWCELDFLFEPRFSSREMRNKNPLKQRKEVARRRIMKCSPPRNCGREKQLVGHLEVEVPSHRTLVVA